MAVRAPGGTPAVLLEKTAGDLETEVACLGSDLSSCLLLDAAPAGSSDDSLLNRSFSVVQTQGEG